MLEREREKRVRVREGSQCHLNSHTCGWLFMLTHRQHSRRQGASCVATILFMPCLTKAAVMDIISDVCFSDWYRKVMNTRKVHTHTQTHMCKRTRTLTIPLIHFNTHTHTHTYSNHTLYKSHTTHNGATKLIGAGGICPVSRAFHFIYVPLFLLCPLQTPTGWPLMHKRINISKAYHGEWSQ